MPVSAAVNALVSKTNNSTLDIKPGAGAEWLIHTLISEQQASNVTPSIEVYRVDDASGTNKKKTMTLLGGEVETRIHVTENSWVQLKNISGSTQFIGYDGVITV